MEFVLIYMPDTEVSCFFGLRGVENPLQGGFLDAPGNKVFFKILIN